MNKKLPLLCGILACLLATITTSRADEYDTLRLKWRLMLTGGTSFNPSDPQIATAITRITNEAQTHWNNMETSPTRTFLWEDLRDLTLAEQQERKVVQTDKDRVRNMNTCYLRLRTMALAYSTWGSTLRGRSDLLAAIKGGLDVMYDTKYNETKTWYGNLWEWNIGIPMSYNDIVVLLYDQLLSTSQMADYTLAVGKYSNDTEYTSGSSTGANKVWRCLVVALHGAIIKEVAKLDMAKRDLVATSAKVFDYVGSSDGYYSDGSFIQHTAHPYNGGYGVVSLYYGAELLNLLKGSTWEITDPKADNIFDWVYNAYEPLIYKGMIFDSVMGRNTASYATNDHIASHKVTAAVMRLAQFADPADAAAYKSMVKHWILSDTSNWGFFTDASIESTVLAKAILNDPSVPNRGELSLYKQYPRMDRVAFHRPGYAFGLSMFSSRIWNYEAINGSNAKGWHSGSGMTYLYNNDAGQYSGNFWATVNHFRLPGTTVLKDVAVDSRKYNGQHYAGNALQHWVGGADLNDLFGVTGMRYKQPDKTLLARKSWFMFDDEIVALGSDIYSRDSKVVETVIENRKLTAAGTNAVTVNDAPQFTSPPTPAGAPVDVTLSGVNWLHLVGNTTGSDVGYYFPTAATLKGRREARTGTWSAIDDRAGIPETEFTDNYLNLWFDHGIDPTTATYAYVLLPNKSSAQVKSYATSPHITVLENSATAQAVRENTLNITAINFWQDVPKTVGGVTTSDASSFIMMDDGGLLDIGIADPTQNKSGTMAYTINQAALSVNTALTSAGFTVTQLRPNIQFTVNMQYARGGTKRLALNTAITVDNVQANNTDGSMATPTPAKDGWTSSTGAGFWGTDSVNDGNTGKGPGKYFTFTPKIPVSGRYKVQIWYVAHPTWRSTTVPVDIVYSTGTTTVTVNQRLTGSQWVTLDTRHFNEGTSGRVVVRTDGTSGTNCYVVADAVRFVPVALDEPVIVDSNPANNPTGSATASATWTLSTGAGNHGGDYYHDGNTGKGPGKYFTFTPNLPSAGNYEVFIWHVAHANRATNVPVVITGTGTATVTVNQQLDGSQWVSLGTHPFAAGTTGTVVVRTQLANGTNTNGYVVADAVRFVKR